MAVFVDQTDFLAHLAKSVRYNSGKKLGIESFSFHLCVPFFVLSASCIIIYEHVLYIVREFV